MKVAHLSDIHFGRIAHPFIVEDLVREVNTEGVDLVAVSGDLTQRARRAQFEAARAMLEAFEAPTLVVPGNHDVVAWWHRPWTRIFDPLHRYRTFISDDLNPSFVKDGLAVLGINSAYGLTIKGGRITGEALKAIRTFFGGQPPGIFKVLVVHHHLTKLQALGPHDVARRARRTLAASAEAGVDLILCGHLHISHIEPLDIVPGKHRIVIASAGTATSNRGRRGHRDTNFYNLVSVTPEAFVIEERRYVPERRRFVTDGTVRFERAGGGGDPVAAAGPEP
ncbi:metallophosphoesterase family protein [Rhodocaloribacter litoris]|uniref:metallophosphoesterase family protein n=1 Tax=Rhodocaloribacter litoris TaxID=2558931 RepID=UPI00141F85DA|nr:metallophosphoesterase family protein [Rhodocaloribacter litoris]QXD16377.1 metallophosphoesterase family protein [Rhodocaloribacter litoris]